MTQQEQTPAPSGGILALLGLDTPANAIATFIWTLPSLVLMLCGLGLMSWLLERFLAPGIPVSGYASAMGLAAVIVFFTLALVRGVALKSEEPPGDSGPDAGGDVS